MNEFRDSLKKIKVLENKLNHCEKNEIDEWAYQLKAEKTRLGRIKREIAQVYNQQKEPVV